jgi:carbon storage regulator
MLILSRRVLETIRIDDEITVTVLSIRAGQIKLGIEAPRNVTVDREEIAERKRRESPPKAGA